MCKAPGCLCALLTMFEHAPDEMVDCVLGDLLPGLDQDISELLDSQWCHLAVSNTLTHNVPDVLDCIQVWRTRVPVNGINAFVIQALPTHSGHIRPSIVLHWEESRAHYTSTRSEDFIPVPTVTAARVPLASVEVSASL